jgi:1-aminocyclopropane-1-carboxylate deaminase
MNDLPIYSPVEEIFNPLFSSKGVQLFIKRDDMIHPFISGNKWRKLKYLLREAEKLQKKHLVTFGGAHSNHLLATACAAAKFGFSSTGIVRGENVENETLLLCRLFGMRLIFDRP